MRNPILAGFGGHVPYHETLETYTVKVVRNPLNNKWKIVDASGIAFRGESNYDYKSTALIRAKEIAINGARMKGAIPVVD